MAELNPAAVDLDAIRAINLGVRVDRATAALPQTTSASIFNVKGGRVLIRLLLGQVTTIIQNQACNTKITFTPTTGSAVDQCANADVANLEVGGKLSLPAAVGTAMVKVNAGGFPLPHGGNVADIGAITLTTGASNTGSVKWSVFYVPLDAGAYVEAA